MLKVVSKRAESLDGQVARLKILDEHLGGCLEQGLAPVLKELREIGRDVQLLSTQLRVAREDLKSVGALIGSPSKPGHHPRNQLLTRYDDLTQYNRSLFSEPRRSPHENQGLRRSEFETVVVRLAFRGTRMAGSPRISLARSNGK